MKPYICTDPIKHDGEYLAIGDSLELDDKQAGPLLMSGVIRLDSDALLAAKPAAASDVVKVNPTKAQAKKPAADEQDANHVGEGDGSQSGEQNGSADEGGA